MALGVRGQLQPFLCWILGLVSPLQDQELSTDCPSGAARQLGPRPPLQPGALQEAAMWAHLQPRGPHLHPKCQVPPTPFPREQARPGPATHLKVEGG